MNVIRTIQKKESKEWIKKLFKAGPHKGDWVPIYPPIFPFPYQLQQDVVGGYLYLVYDGALLGYGRIAAVKKHTGSPVGTTGDPVSPGEAIHLTRQLTSMPRPLEARGFQGIRYILENLHKLPPDKAQETLNKALGVAR
ncbi:MAG TPA: hypothetical protein VEY88_17130 [Archangium sp.]|nr:hypothetical protein [Archangium sp.]